MSADLMDSTRAVRWPVHPLKDVVEQLFVGLPVSRYQAREGQRAIQEPVLSVGDIDAGQIAPRTSLASVALRQENYERFRAQAGDVLLSCRGSLLKVARVSEEAAGLLVSSNLIVVRPGEKLTAAVLLVLLHSPDWQAELRLKSRSSSALMQLTTKDVERLSVPVPPPHVQAIVSELMEAEDVHYRGALQVAEARRSLATRLALEVLSAPPRQGQGAS